MVSADPAYCKSKDPSDIKALAPTDMNPDWVMMRLQKPITAWTLSLMVVAITLGGCSKKQVVKPVTIPDSSASKNTGKPRSPGSEYDTLWDRLFALYALPPVENSDIDREISWFANHPAYLERAQNRADPFLYSIVKYIEKQGVPGELALLPIVESAFQPHVVSPARAAGIWQFIPTTGTHYGLKRSHSYDGRRDVYASTKAAIRYLKKLHGDFGDWLLAIAAYNCGEGAVGRAVRRNEAAGLPIDFWSLNLPRETRAYVPKLLAVSRIFADSDRYGVPLREMPNSAKFKPVKVNSRLDLALAADAAGISLDKLYELNPGFRGQVADVEGSYHLYIPANKKAAEFRQEVERLKLERNAIMPSMSGEDIAAQEPNAFESFRREAAQQREAAASSSEADRTPALPQRYSSADSERNSDAASAGEVDTSNRSRYESRADADKDNEPAKPKRERSLAKETSHSVQRGETLYEIARRFSVSPSQLAKWNDIPVNTEVRTGQKLVVSENGEAPVTRFHSTQEKLRSSAPDPKSKSDKPHRDTHESASSKHGKSHTDTGSKSKGSESKGSSHDKKSQTSKSSAKSKQH